MPYIQNVGKRQWTNVWLESLKKEEGIFENTVGDNISNFLKTINTQIPPFSPKKKNFRHKWCEDNCTKAQNNQIFQSQEKSENLKKVSREKRHISVQKNEYEDGRILTRNKQLRI